MYFGQSLSDFFSQIIVSIKNIYRHLKNKIKLQKPDDVQLLSQIRHLKSFSVDQLKHLFAFSNIFSMFVLEV